MPDNEAANRIHEAVHSVNPFKERGEYSRLQILTFKVLTPLTWLLLVVTTVYYTFEPPHEGKRKRRTIWRQDWQHESPFALNSIITSIYWIVLYVLQIGYVFHLFSSNTVYVQAACEVGRHFVANNLLLFGFVHLWVRSYFWLAELLLVINFFNLTAAYFLHNTTPRFIHIPVVSGPLAWNFVALYWCGAVMVGASNWPARIVANIFVWGILVFGLFFLAAYKDYTIGFELSVLSAALGVAQFQNKVFALQWIFAFIIMALLFISSLAVGANLFKRGEDIDEDRERAPLLTDD